MFGRKGEAYLIAEIGGNHEGSISKAKDLLISVAEAGADAVKFQILQAERLVSEREDPERFEHFKRLSLNSGRVFRID